MKKQTFIICLEDQEGRMVNFERWYFKSMKRCVDAMVGLYRSCPSIYRSDLERAARVVCYPTPDGYHRKAAVWSVSVDEFREMMMKEATT